MNIFSCIRHTTFERKEGGMMEREKRKIWICLICVVLLAVTIGIIYICASKTEIKHSERNGTLVKLADEKGGKKDGKLRTDSLY